MTRNNDCGECGTNLPNGGWEAENGRVLVLAKNGAFTAFLAGDEAVSGIWTMNEGNLCLDPDDGDEVCFRFEQRGDMIRLNQRAVFERR